GIVGEGQKKRPIVFVARLQHSTLFQPYNHEISSNIQHMLYHGCIGIDTSELDGRALRATEPGLGYGWLGHCFGFERTQANCLLVSASSGTAIFRVHLFPYRAGNWLRAIPDYISFSPLPFSDISKTTSARIR